MQVGAYWEGDNWIFTQDNGKMMSYYTPYSALQDILTHYNADKAEADKLPMIPFHGLRHPYVKHTTKNFSCKSRNPKPPTSCNLGFLFLLWFD